MSLGLGLGSKARTNTSSISILISTDMPPKRGAATKAAAESKAKANGAGPSKLGDGSAKVDKVSGGGDGGADGPAGPAKKKQRTKKEAAVDGAEEETAAKPAPPASPKKEKTQKKSQPKGEDDQEAKSGEPAATAAAAAAHPSAPPPGGSKMDTTAPEELPRNTSVPDPLSFEGDEKSKKQDGDVRIASWNVTSFKSVLTKGFMRYVEAEQADVLFLSETKVSRPPCIQHQDKPAETEEPAQCNDVPMHPRLSEIYPYQTWGIGLKKGYGGVALLSKQKPLKVTTGLATSAGEDSPQDTKGRLITAEFSNYILAGTYVVNAGEGLKTMPQKQAWNAAFARHLKECNERKPTIWTGDLNVVLDSRDLSAASKKWNKSPGYTAVS